MLKRTFLAILSITLCTTIFNHVFAQPPTWTIDLLGKEKKPEKFAERKLGSEKMAEKKFNLYRRVVQNNFTHYNYYFNANNKINAVLERAKLAQRDDYTKLIGYYPYTFENTASQKTELDSVIYKATAGILLHDLRNAWVDDMYLLMGKAYYLRKDFDTAAATFQFINYNLFPRKKDEDGSRVIGTTEDASNSKISIANKEKQNILQKLTARPPSRNDALVWLARTLIEQDELGEAAGLIHTLQNDPNLPKRLADDLNDVNGYWFFKQNIYDSAAVYLEKGLSSAANKQDKARAEFLLAQLYEATGQFDKATSFYNFSSVHTTNPLLDIYAQLNNAKMRKGNNLKELEKGIGNLLTLSKRDKFEMYRDIIFYSSGELAMQKPDTNQAILFYNKSIKYNETNIPYKNKAFLQLAEIAYSRKEYKDAYRYYDSLQSGDTTLIETLAKIQDRRNSLSKIVEKIVIIEREDSLQHIAAMEPAAREIFVKKLSKKLRKEKGIKEDDKNINGSNDLISFDKDKDKPADLFGGNEKSNGEWYFYNASLKSKGFNDFKRKWGQRTNTDNWRRKDALAEPASNRVPDNIGITGSNNPDDLDAPVTAINDLKNIINSKDKTSLKNTATAVADDQPEDISYEGMMSHLPLTPEKLTASNHLLATSLFGLGKLFQQELEEYQEAINTYDQSLKRFPDSVYGGEIFLNLAYCYSKLGNTAQADRYKKLVSSKYGEGKAAKMLTEITTAKTSEKNPEGTKRYEGIYNLFIEGKFEGALAEKKKADSLYGKNYWSPQLLYIEAVYQVKQKNDSAAIDVLKNIITLYPKSALKAKAQRMIEVLGRRKEIEKYLTDLQVTRATEDETIVTNDRVAMVRNDSNLIKSPKLFDSSKAVIKPAEGQAKKDSMMRSVAPVVIGPYTFNAAAPHYVIMLLDKVDGTYINESKNAFTRYVGDNFRASAITITKDGIDKDFGLLVFTPFANATAALEFLYKIRKDAPDEISWLPVNKYSFLLIDDNNLQRLKTTKDIAGYKNLLNKQYPGLIK